MTRRCACGCGRIAQRERAWAWLCDPEVSPELKHAARAKGGRKVLVDVPDPRFATEEGRRAFREAIAGAVVRGEMSEARATVALKACEHAAAEGRRSKGEKPPRPPVLVEPWRRAEKPA